MATTPHVAAPIASKTDVASSAGTDSIEARITPRMGRMVNPMIATLRLPHPGRSAKVPTRSATGMESASVTASNTPTPTVPSTSPRYGNPNSVELLSTSSSILSPIMGSIAALPVWNEMTAASSIMTPSFVKTSRYDMAALRPSLTAGSCPRAASWSILLLSTPIRTTKAAKTATEVCTMKKIHQPCTGTTSAGVMPAIMTPTWRNISFRVHRLANPSNPTNPSDNELIPGMYIPLIALWTRMMLKTPAYDFTVESSRYVRAVRQNASAIRNFFAFELSIMIPLSGFITTAAAYLDDISA
eukprot:m.405127 g.405127  ORF g.405127 m.405127 type:complete len:300 (-) comp21204_c0_seq7:535-1434(-)